MKKVIMTMVFAAVAVCAHAASVKWSATSVKDINGNAAKNVTGWSVVCTIYSDAGGTQIVGQSTATSSNAMSKFSGIIDGTATDKNYWTQLVITDDKGNTLSSDIVAFTTDSSAEYGELNFSTGAKFASSGAKIDYAGGWTAAPEPTSGILLLLGVAGLALKRKRA